MPRFVALRNVVKAWLLLIGLCGLLAFVGWAIGGIRLLSIFVFCALLLGARAQLRSRVGVSARRARGRDCARAGPCEASRRRPADGGGRVVGFVDRAESDRWLARTRAALRPRTDRSSLRARAPLTEAGV